jgi:hypothetical protein
MFLFGALHLFKLQPSEQKFAFVVHGNAYYQSVAPFQAPTERTEISICRSLQCILSKHCTFLSSNGANRNQHLSFTAMHIIKALHLFKLQLSEQKSAFVVHGNAYYQSVAPF